MLVKLQAPLAIPMVRVALAYLFTLLMRFAIGFACAWVLTAFWPGSQLMVLAVGIFLVLSLNVFRYVKDMRKAYLEWIGTICLTVGIILSALAFNGSSFTNPLLVFSLFVYGLYQMDRL